MKEQTNWDVLIGVPSSGKTKLITYLSVLGFPTVSEVARTIIDVDLSYGNNLHEIRGDTGRFQSRVVTMKIEQERRLNPDKYLFLDTGVPCSFAYCFDHNTWIDSKAAALATEYSWKYKNIFLLEPNKYERDNVRTEKDEERVTLYFHLRDVYKNYGYDVIEIPQMPIPERALAVLKYRGIKELPEISEEIYPSCNQ